MYVNHQVVNSPDGSERFVATEFREDRGFVSGEVHDGNAYAMGGA